MRTFWLRLFSNQRCHVHGSTLPTSIPFPLNHLPDTSHVLAKRQSYSEAVLMANTDIVVVTPKTVENVGMVDRRAGVILKKRQLARVPGWQSHIDNESICLHSSRTVAS